MSIGNNKKSTNKRNNKGNIKLVMASDILNHLGEKNHECHTYSGYGLKIVKPDMNSNSDTDIYVDFNNQRVLDNKTYTPGLWEGVLSEIHQNIDLIIAERKKQDDLLKKKRKVLKYLNRLDFNDVIKIDNVIYIEKFKHLSEFYDEYYGISYEVYYNGNLVYNAFHSDSLNSDKFYLYESGNWEDKVIDYVSFVEEKNKHDKSSKNKKNESKSLSGLDNIKVLTKIRKK